jgi:CelD/BcsL family acetyltransferase involved in cellulose biosynthesis
MQEPLVFTDFLDRRITQLWAQAAKLPERSPAQAHIEWLACELSDYMSGLKQEPLHSKKRKPRKPINRTLRAE